MNGRPPGGPDEYRLSRPVRAGVVSSFACAFRGIVISFKSERNLKIHAAAAGLAIVVGLYVGISWVEWALVVFAIGFVLVWEAFNTAVERLADEVSGGRYSQPIRDVKDISAAAVLVSAVTALVIGILVLAVPLVRRVVEAF